MGTSFMRPVHALGKMPSKILDHSLVLPIVMVCVSACSSGSSDSSAPDQGNRPPSISGSPPAYAMLDLIYSFTPGSADPDGDTLTYSVSNMPAWASFDTATGNLTGTPSMQHVGNHGDILISASDGQATTDLPAFAIEVVAGATGSLTLSWTPPTRSADGSPLDDLAGYRIRWGTQTGDRPNLLELNNPGVSSYVVDSLAPGSYFLTVFAVDTSNNESEASNEANGTVQ
jgi:hypothetical protein